MRVAVFSAKADRDFLEPENRQRHELVYFDTRLTGATAALARGSAAVCLFVNDNADARVLQELVSYGTRLLTLRCSGTNNVDLASAKVAGLAVSRVPAYSPHAVAEHCFAPIWLCFAKF